jgi:hypothetical protein
MVAGSCRTRSNRLQTNIVMVRMRSFAGRSHSNEKARVHKMPRLIGWVGGNVARWEPV